MIFDKEGNTTIVFQEAPTLMQFLENLKQAYPKLQHDNLIINLGAFKNLTVSELLKFKELSDAHRAGNQSFVLVTNQVTYEDVPEDLFAVPTVQEARDLIEMEEIERDLEL